MVRVARDGVESGIKNKIVLTKLPDFDSGSLWKVDFEGRLKSDFEGVLYVPVSINALIESRDEDGHSHQYRSPWVPSSLELKPGVNRFAFSLPVKPAAMPGHIESVSIDFEYGGPSDSNNYFGAPRKYSRTRSAPKAKLTRALVDNHVSWQKSRLKLSELPYYPTAIGFEIY
ncbi:MAG: hypothetical protein K8F91_15770 [Candidatus Obscuribacterales bacterium]|nr:hypothetical protein [Candidatus Obscuribacterales bacterium]